MAIEIFANQPSTTVSSGGTSAPAPGTVETWTVASSASFPAASNTASPPTQFHVIDTATGKTGEIIAVTNVGGTTWTVTRGSESGTPVAHAAGFTVTQVVTAGGLRAFANVAPGAVTLTDASTVSIDATTGTRFQLTTTSGVGATRQLGTPTGPGDGQQITIAVTQDTAGARLLTYSAAWLFPYAGAPVLSTTPGYTDVLQFTYNAALSGWMFMGISAGFPGTSTTIFYDNFAEIASGASPSAQKWAMDVLTATQDPTNGAANYTDKTDCVYVDSNGDLIIAVTPVTGGTTQATQARGNYNSGRICTFIDTDFTVARPGFQWFSATWGTITVVAKVNSTAGFWPAIWMFGATAQWPSQGEIDIMENFGTATGFNLTTGYGNIIGPKPQGSWTTFGYDNASPILFTPPAIHINDGSFHTYQLNIASDYNTISFSLDGTAYTGSPVTKAAWQAAGGSTAVWPFGPTAQLGLVLNSQVGCPGISGPVTSFPSTSVVYPLKMLTVQSVQWTQP